METVHTVGFIQMHDLRVHMWDTTWQRSLTLLHLNCLRERPKGLEMIDVHVCKRVTGPNYLFVTVVCLCLLKCASVLLLHTMKGVRDLNMISLHTVLYFVLCLSYTIWMKQVAKFWLYFPKASCHGAKIINKQTCACVCARAYLSY